MFHCVMTSAVLVNTMCMLFMLSEEGLRGKKVFDENGV